MFGRKQPVSEGERIRLVSMEDDPDPIPVGTEGTVTGVEDLGDWWQIDVEWDNDRTLMLTVPPDRFTIIRGTHEV